MNDCSLSSFFFELTHWHGIVFHFKVKLRIFWEDIELFHHLVKHFYLLEVGKALIVASKKFLWTYLRCYWHLLALTVKENLNRDGTSFPFSFIEWYQRFMLSLHRVVKTASYCENIAVEQLTSFMLLKKNSSGKGILVLLNSGNSRKHNYVHWLYFCRLLDIFSLTSFDWRHLDHISYCGQRILIINIMTLSY